MIPIKSMRILYIHGLDSAPNPDRTASLEVAGHQVFALHLDYRNQPDAYAQLRAFGEQEQVEYIVGHTPRQLWNRGYDIEFWRI
jgi:hypothetical protein